MRLVKFLGTGKYVNRNPLLKKSSELFGEESIAFISRMSFLLLISHSQYSHTPSYTTDRSQIPSIQNYLKIFGSNMDPVNDESFLSKNSFSFFCKIALFSYIFCSYTLNTPLHLILKIELKNILDNEIYAHNIKIRIISQCNVDSCNTHSCYF